MTNSNIIPPSKEYEINKHTNLINKMVSKWRFTGHSKKDKIEQVRLWLSNFECDEIPYIVNLLNYIFLVDEEKIEGLIDIISKHIRQKFNLNDIIILSLEEDRASSGSQFLYKLKKKLGIDEPNIANSFNYSEEKLRSVNHLVFIDDVIGSGNQASKQLEKWININANCHYFSFLGLNSGLTNIKNKTGITPFSALEFYKSDEVFSEKSPLQNKAKCKAIAQKYGDQLYFQQPENKRHPLGYDDSQLLVCFRDDCPNNTLPIIWAGENSELKSLESTTWHPLFERKYVPKPTKDSTTSKQPVQSHPLGYFINIGTTSSRLFEVINRETLRECARISYTINAPEQDGYLDGIINHIKSDLLPRMGNDPSQHLRKVFVDCNFIDVFKEEEAAVQKDFVRKFYKETKLYFNILSKNQTVDNLRRLFVDLPDKTAIVNIASQSVDIYIFADGKLTPYSLDITLIDVKTFVENKNYPEIWSDVVIKEIKDFIQKKIVSSLKNITIENALILKDELKFMQSRNYPLKFIQGRHGLSQRDYAKTNKEILFTFDYRQSIERETKNESEQNRLYGFKYGHILIETILEYMKNKTVIPKDDLSIHGSPITAYLFNIVISGSTNPERIAYMFEARKILSQMKGISILSPFFTSDGQLAKPITPDTEYEHLKAIDECDVLFICNGGDKGYLGESTKCQIYYAYAQKKTIAFWCEPPEEEQLSCIPHEHWGTIKKIIL